VGILGMYFLLHHLKVWNLWLCDKKTHHLILACHSCITLFRYSKKKITKVSNQIMLLVTHPHVIYLVFPSTMRRWIVPCTARATSVAVVVGKSWREFHLEREREVAFVHVGPHKRNTHCLILLCASGSTFITLLSWWVVYNCPDFIFNLKH
jgi:hypothetical protein